MSQIAQRDLAVARDYLSSGEIKKARLIAQHAKENSPNSSDVELIQGYIEDTAGNSELASKHYAEAVRLGPNNAAAQNAYGAWLCSSGSFAEADIYFRRALSNPKSRSNASALINAGICALNSGNTKAAIAYMRPALQLQPENPALLAAMADVSLRDGDAMSARAFLQRREALEPLSPDLMMLGIRIEEKLGDARAIKRYREALEAMGRKEDADAKKGITSGEVSK